ncbi:hypothetical protein ACH5RR_040867 [Cinchona calisaya]|uniref:DUF4283 domain-containing protein n=1 Tax=Cinchona calisaya TaxID=153742 RepID=A0ABD2XVY5_9GENT
MNLGESKGSWADVVRASTHGSRGIALNYITPNIVNIQNVFQISIDEVKSGLDKWKNGVVGFVSRHQPNGFYVLVFESEEMKIEVLSQAAWRFFNKILYLKAWFAGMDLTQTDIVRVPIWVRFSQLKFHYYADKTLIKFASVYWESFVC